MEENNDKDNENEIEKEQRPIEGEISKLYVGKEVTKESIEEVFGL